MKDLVRSKIVPQLRKALQKLGPTLIAEHGKDIQHAPGSNPSSGFATPITITTSSTAAQANAKPKPSSTATSGGKDGPLINTTTVTSSEEFRTTAAELFETFTARDRLAAFTRSPPTVFDGAHPGGKFALFGGNVSGSYVTLEEPRKLVQNWRLGQWPEGHFSKLEIGFDQNDVDSVTVMRVKWEGVPIGQEEVTRRNWGEYYVKSIKTTFG